MCAAPTHFATPPIDRPDQVQPFTVEQAQKQIAAAKRTSHPRRDEVMLLTLLDTGVRASELCALKVGDADLQSGLLHVRDGKGGKGRTIPFSRDTRRALYQYFAERTVEDGEALFLSDRGRDGGYGLTPRGLCSLIARIGEKAGVDGAARCSPHTWLHTLRYVPHQSGRQRLLAETPARPFVTCDSQSIRYACRGGFGDRARALFAHHKDAGKKGVENQWDNGA